MTTDSAQALAEEQQQQQEQRWRRCVFFLVGNIPAKFRSADLRAMFSHFVEKEYFVCFHYRHRPEQVQASEAHATSSSSSNTVTDIEELTRDTSPARAGGGVTKTRCCVAALERNGRGARTFVEMYANKNWSTADGGFLRQKVRITQMKVNFKTTGQNLSPSNQGKIIDNDSM